MPVQPDPSITVTGRVVDPAGNPVPGATVGILSEGVDAEFFDFTTELTALPELTGLSPDRVTRLTAINMRNPDGVFGSDPIGSRLAPDYAGRLTGWLSIAAPGTHTFVLGASDGARLTVGGITVVDMGLGTAEYRENSGAIALQAGLAPFEVTFYHGVGGNGELQLSIVPADGGGVRTVSPALLSPSGRALTVSTDAAGRFTVRNVPTALGSVQVWATPVDGSRSGSSSLFVPAPRADVDVGDVVIPAP
jgi:hypothetical protein